MSRVLLMTIALLAGLTAVLPGDSSAEDPPRILTVPELIEGCRSLTGDPRDECLVNLALFEQDAAICQAAPESRCAEILGTILMPRCDRYAGDERFACEIAVAQETASVEACAAALDRNACVGAVASVRDDPQIIVDNIGDAAARDIALATHAAVRRDPAAVDLIADNRQHDLARVYIVSSIGVGLARIIDPSYCDGMRGDYDDDADQEGEDDVRRLCDMAVAFSNLVTARQAVAETAAERNAVATMIQDIVAAMERGEVSVDDLVALAGGRSSGGSGCSAIPGVWSWFVNGDVTFSPDGTQQQGAYSGTWNCSGSQVHLSWNHGYEDEMTLSADGTQLSGTGRARDPGGPQGYSVTGSKIR